MPIMEFLELMKIKFIHAGADWSILLAMKMVDLLFSTLLFFSLFFSFTFTLLHFPSHFFFVPRCKSHLLHLLKIPLLTILFISILLLFLLAKREEMALLFLRKIWKKKMRRRRKEEKEKKFSLLWMWKKIILLVWFFSSLFFFSHPSFVSFYREEDWDESENKSCDISEGFDFLPFLYDW